jgi:uncharacterized protein YcaQ
MSVTKEDLRRYAITRSLFPPTTLKRAVHKLGFVQADPIRAPARAQDLTLRHRVRNYRAGDLERRYAGLGVQEDFFVNYGFVAEEIQALMHPRGGPAPWPRSRAKHVQALLEFVRARGEVHPREVDDHFSHGTVTNYWGGSSNATTHLLDGMHYRGLLRVTRRLRGIRIYAAHDHPPQPLDRASRLQQLDALVDVAVRTYAPLPSATMSWLINRLRYGAPQWQRELGAAQARARARLRHARVEGIDWYWPAADRIADSTPDEKVRLLAPFDPIVWDRRRFELFWGWEYRFEAYTPIHKRRLGYYALPLLWRDRVIGWANASVRDGSLKAEMGYIDGKAPREPRFARELESELHRMTVFLGLGDR